MFFDLMTLLVACIPIYITKDPGGFRLALLAGIGLAAVCWFVCSIYTRMWNKRFRITLLHHASCAFASLCTLFFVVLFASLYYTKDAASASVAAWQYQIAADRGWESSTFQKAYDRVKELGIEDFSSVPAPGDPSSFIPTNADESRQTAAATYANEACKHFDTKRPFLGKVVWSSPGVPQEVIFEDVKEWHQTNPNYPPSRAIEIAGTQVRNGLEPQLPRVTSLSRLSVTILFVLIQAIPFGLIGWAAYRDIRAQV